MNKVKLQILLEILRRENKISPSIFDDGLNSLDSDVNPIDELLKNETISKTDVLVAMDQYLNTPYVDLDMVDINLDFSKVFGLDLLKLYEFIPLY